MHQRLKVPTMALSRVLLTSGRSVDLTELRLSATYGDVLEGYPCKLLNDLAIAGSLRSAAHVHPDVPVHLIPPPREYPDQFAGGFGPVEVLPRVTCVGSFRSEALDPGHDRALYRSRLTVVWFQPTPLIPSGCDAETALLDMDWEQLATDEEL